MLKLPHTRSCFVCGLNNPLGLKLDFETDGRIVRARFAPRPEHVGFKQTVHGGLISTVLDEAMGWAMYAAGAWAMTARMEVKYRRPLPLGEELLVSAEVTRDRGRRLEAEAEVRTASGEVLAQAFGLFLRAPAERARELDASFLGDGVPTQGTPISEDADSRSSGLRSRSS